MIRMGTRTVTGENKKINNLFLLGAIAIPPLLLVLGLLLASKNYEFTTDTQSNLWAAKTAIYTSFLSIIGVIGVLSYLSIKKRVGNIMLAFSLTICLLYSIFPISLMAEKISSDDIRSTNIVSKKNHVTLRTLLFSEPHYQMKSEEITKLLTAINKLEVGSHYIKVLKLLPPVPEGCPIIMRKLDSNEMILVYFVTKRNEGPEINESDRHISLYFDSQENLKKIKTAI
jgi:hypothetical protein